MHSPKCKLCGHEHALNEPHRFENIGVTAGRGAAASAGSERKNARPSVAQKDEMNDGPRKHAQPPISPPVAPSLHGDSLVSVANEQDKSDLSTLRKRLGDALPASERKAFYKIIDRLATLRARKAKAQKQWRKKAKSRT